jgi:hypothetical protein
MPFGTARGKLSCQTRVKLHFNIGEMIMPALLRLYLLILCGFELMALYRLLYVGEPAGRVAPYLPLPSPSHASHPEESAFHHLFTTFLAILLATRASLLLSPDYQPDAYRMAALIHVIEALWLVPTALDSDALPSSFALSEFQGRKGEAAFITFFVVLNAALFTGIAWGASKKVEGGREAKNKSG